MKYLCVLCPLVFLLAACAASEPQEDGQENITYNDTIRSRPVPVKVVEVKKGDFPLEVSANGRLRARRKIELRLETGGQIGELHLREGQWVDKGALLLKLDGRAQQLQLEQYELALEEARVNKADLLIANGGQAFADSSVSAEKLQLINTLSGYDKARHAIEQARYELSKTELYAPFSGIVADVKVAALQWADAGATVCTLIGPASFEAVFTLLEEDALKVRLGQHVKIYPLSLPDVELSGRISAINPVVDEQGLATFFARLDEGAQAPLFEGMNVKVVVEQMVPDQLAVPKTAVVLRSGKPVVFTYDSTEQLAKWNYVTIAYENGRAAAIGSGLKAKALAIYEGNLNLDHDASVQLHE